MKTLVGSLPKPPQACWKFAGAPPRLLEVAKRSQEHMVSSWCGQPWVMVGGRPLVVVVVVNG